MSSRVHMAALGLVLAASWSAPVHAQAEDVQQQLSELRAQLKSMAQRVDVLEHELADARARDEPSPAQPASGGRPAAVRVAMSTPIAAAEPTITWKGAPEIRQGGWSFKPRGRMQFDAGVVSAPASTGLDRGYGAEGRRIRFGAEGTVPGGFDYRFEAELANGPVEMYDAWLAYSAKGLRITVGQHNPFQSLDELTGSTFSSFIERAAYTDAFGFERRLGLSAQLRTGDVLVQGGVFADNLTTLPDKSWSLDARAVYMPRLGGAQLHLGGSLHYTRLNDAAASVRYRQRPLVHFSDARFIDTRSFTADAELGAGAEAALIAGPFHAAAEGFWQRVERPRLPSPTFFGGYGELGYFLTHGDTRGYANGAFARTRPKHPLGDGGIGAVQVVGRYDYLDLSDASIVGGRQAGYEASAIWQPGDYVRFMINYARLEYRDAAVPAGTDDSYAADVVAVRSQLDF